jgi:micrococcal nuclease
VTPTGPAYTYSAVLHRVVDGDTYELTIDLGFRVYARLMVRLLGYSSPERNAKGGSAATRVAQTILENRPLLVRSYRDKQTFARWLGEVWVMSDFGDWQSVGALLVIAGAAVVDNRTGVANG